MSPQMVKAIIHRDVSWIKAQPQLNDMYSVVVISWYWYQRVCNLAEVFDLQSGYLRRDRNMFCRYSRSSFFKQFNIYSHKRVNINRRAQSIQKLRENDVKDLATKEFKSTQEYNLMLFIRKYIILIDQAAAEFGEIDALNPISLSWTNFVNDLGRSVCKHYIK